jgi:alanyl-tRNA synthetase
VIRHINIDGIDRNACCGTQLPNTTYCQALHIIPPSTPSTATKPSSNTPTKLFFTAGPRALKYLLQSSKAISLAAQSLGTAREAVVERLVKNEESRKETVGKERDLRAELARVLGEAAVDRTQGGIVWVQRGEKSTHDIDFLGQIATTFQAGDVDKGRLEAPVIVLTSGIQGSAGPTLLLVLSASNDLAKGVYERLKTALEGDAKGRVKGGGARGRYMSKIEDKWGKDDIAKVLDVIDEVSDAEVSANK